MGFLNINWDDLEKISDEDITYFLYLEGKNIDAICRIRNISREAAGQQIVSGKIKYGYLAKSRNEKELFTYICNAGKQDRINMLNSIDLNNKKRLIKYISQNYDQMNISRKASAIWIIGECSENLAPDILVSGAVHEHVTIRRMAVSAMGKLKDIRFEDSLTAALNDDNPQVVLYAIKSLRKIGSKKCIESIRNIARKTDKEYLKSAAAEFLNEVSE